MIGHICASTMQTTRPRVGDAHCQCRACILALPSSHKDEAQVGSSSVRSCRPSFAFVALPQVTATVCSLLGHVNKTTGQIRCERQRLLRSLHQGSRLLVHIPYSPIFSIRGKNCFWTHSTPSRLTWGLFSLPEISIFFFSEMALF